MKLEHDAFETLRSLGADIFLYEVHRHVDRSRNGIEINNTLFWNSLYQEHSEDETAFESFLGSSCQVLCISGRVGAGKSTYLWRRMQSLRSCEIINIDLLHYFDRLDRSDGSESSVLAVLEELLHESIKKRILDNLIYRSWILNTESSLGRIAALVEEREDVYNRINIDLPPLDIPSQRTRRVAESAEVDLAALAVIHLNTPHLSDVIRKLDILPTDSSVSTSEYNADLRRRAANRLVDPNVLASILKCLKWTDYLTLYQALYVRKPPTVLMYDNLDVVSVRKIQRSFVESVFDIGNMANRKYAETIINRAHLETKLAFSIRHENIARLNLSGGFAERIFHITMDKRDRPLPVSQVRQLEFDVALACSALRKRLDVLRRLLPDNPYIDLFCAIATEFWIRETSAGPEVFRRSGSIDNYQFCNNSMRIFLFTVYATTLSTLKHRVEHGIEDGVSRAGFSINLAKGRMIRSLQEHPGTRRIPDAFYRGIRGELNGEPCCLYRSVLTTLFCYETPTNIALFAQSIEDTFGYGLLDTIQVIYDLYAATTHHGDMVDIFQESYIESVDDVDLNGEVQLTYRGIEFLQRVVISVDYIGGYNNRTENVLVEMEPSKALHYVDISIALIKRLFVSHIAHWHSVIRLRLLGRGIERPLEYYRAWHSCTGNFYILRVVDSHIGSISDYVIEALRGPDSSLALSPEDRKTLVEQVPRNLMAPHDQTYPPDRSQLLGAGSIVDRVVDSLDGTTALYQLHHRVIPELQNLLNAGRAYEGAFGLNGKDVDLDGIFSIHALDAIS